MSLPNSLESVRIAVVGLGYVGLPLALAFGQRFHTVGFDIDTERVAELKTGYDRTREVEPGTFAAANHLCFTAQPDDIATCTVFVITVPTPIDAYKRPDLSFLLKASQTVGQRLKRGDLVIFESTVYPGCTEEDCVPVLEASSGLAYNRDFYCGYSPERINPGDRVRTLTTIRKVTAGSTPEAAAFTDALYAGIIEAGTYRAPSIKVAEAAKAIENAQRDINISFVNELALLFDRMGIDTLDVLEAAGTKWNFLNFRPGLVGGHCISVDPYYLTHKAQSLGYHPQVILSGRRVNDDMAIHVANKLVKTMTRRGLHLTGSRVLLLGITFKENCSDIRNTKVAEIYHELTSFGIQVDVYDPRALPDEVAGQLGIRLLDAPGPGCYDGIVLAVSHDEFRTMDIAALRRNEQSIVYDLKGIVSRTIATLRI